MRHRLLAILFPVTLLAIAVTPAHAIGNPDVIPLPFPPEPCRMLIDRGAPFQLGGPDTNDCFVVINYNQR